MEATEQTTDIINVQGTLKTLEIMEAVQFPLSKRSYAAILAVKLKHEMGRVFITKTFENTVIVIRLK